MPRQAREKCESGIYHVMLRGVNRQQIFEDDEDSQKYLSLLSRYREECGYELFGYCLMGNHVHLLIRENDTPLETIFRKIGTAYVYYFNAKYERIGHLFQDRFRSEPVLDDAQLLQTLRYIHRNPIKAGICGNPEDYYWSSYRDYLSKRRGLTDTDYILSMISREDLIRFTETENEDVFLEDRAPTGRHITDQQAKHILQKTSGCGSAADFQKMGKNDRNHAISELRKKGLSITQINRLTGVSRTIISRAGTQ